MHIKKKLIKFILIIAVFIAVFECLYLFLFPFILNNAAEKGILNKLVNKYTNAYLIYDNLKFKTNINFNLLVSLDKLTLKDKEQRYTLINADDIDIDISLISLLKKEINIKKLEADNMDINITMNKDGVFNFEKLFSGKNKNNVNPVIKRLNINIDNYKLNFNDELLNRTITAFANPLTIFIKERENISIRTKGYILSSSESIQTKTGTKENNISSNYNLKSDFDIDLKTILPVKFNSIKPYFFNGKCFVDNIDLNLFADYVKKYFDRNITDLSGRIDYIQLSTAKNEDKQEKIIFNTRFSDINFGKNDWKNKIKAAGENVVNAGIYLQEGKININSFNYKAQDVNVKADGFVKISAKKPELDINVEVSDSRAENIVQILPPTLVPKLRTIEKVKTYGIYGDIEGKVNIKGTVPQPDITGYVNGHNIHILDKSLHNKHKGTISLTFDKRILNMDILVNLIDNQSAKVNGYVYMYRDGINNVKVKTTDNIDFPLAQKIIVPISKVFNFQLGPIPDMEIYTGKGVIDIDVKGSIDTINIDGYSRFNDAALSYNGLYGKVDYAEGELNFKEDIIEFKTLQAFVKSNPLQVEGRVKINNHFDFNISSSNAQVKDLLEIINKSTLLKDVKDGISIITDAENAVRIFINLKAKIVPVAYGEPPLPPEEAFKDMKVKGALYLLGNSCFIEGFRTPVDNIKGIVDFTETQVVLNSLTGISGSSPIKISGQINTDLETKIPDVDIEVTGKEIKLKDTIKFLTESYLYPENYPNLSNLYKTASKHDLYFKYKAKSVDFEPDKAYAVINFIPDNEDNPIKAKSGRIIMNKSVVTIEDVNAALYDSNVMVTGNIKDTDTQNPEYNLKIKTDDFNISNLNNIEKITIMPEQIKKVLKQFNNYKGTTGINIEINKNVLKGEIDANNISLTHKSTGAPLRFDNFIIYFKNNKIIVNDVAAQIGDMPFFGDITVSNLYKKPYINSYFTAKLTNNFIKTYLPEALAKRIDVEGDIGFSSRITGNINNLNIIPKLTLNTDADISFDKTNIGETNDKRELTGEFNISPDKINIKKFDYIKYISSQNNKTYPMTFATSYGVLKKNGKEIELDEFNIKTHKNLPARFLNLFLKSPVLKQGTFNCNLKYKMFSNNVVKIIGNMDCRNIDIPLFDTIIKNIQFKADKKDIDLKVFGFISESRIIVNSKIENNIKGKPKIAKLDINADRIDRDKLLKNLSDTHKAMNTNNKIKNIDLNGLSIENGHIEVKELLVKSLIANNFRGDFSIDENGIFLINNMILEVEQGNLQGVLSYNLNDTTLTGDFELNNIDSNYIAQTLFEGKNQIYGQANGKIYLKTKGTNDEERIKNLSGMVYCEISDGRMPKLGSLEYLLRASNIVKSGITGFTLNSILELLNLVKTGYFSSISGSCMIEDGVAKDIEIFSKGENLSLYIQGTYDITKTHAELEILGKLSKRISTIFGTLGNTSLNTFFKLIPGISMFDFGRENFIEDVEKIPSFTNGDYESRIFQAIIDGDINESGYVQSFKWVQ